MQDHRIYHDQHGQPYMPPAPSFPPDVPQMLLQLPGNDEALSVQVSTASKEQTRKRARGAINSARFREKKKKDEEVLKEIQRLKDERPRIQAEIQQLTRERDHHQSECSRYRQILEEAGVADKSLSIEPPRAQGGVQTAQDRPHGTWKDTVLG